MFKYINFLLLAILLLIFSCDEEPKPVIEGCTIETACNYNADATDDDDSCVFNQGCNQWCNGDEGEPQVFDCLSECGGDAVYDNCGEECVAGDPEADCSEHCDNDPSNDCVQDCANDWGGSAVVDVCDVCGGNGSSCTDCNGDINGTAVEDECGVCDADASNDNTPLTGTCDCNGDPNGEASIDGCADCVGGDTGLTACANDCLGDIGGDAVYDNCGEACIAADPEADCSEHCDNNPENDCVQDCNGDWGGSAVEDNCDTCDADGSNDCVQDCGDEWGGDAELDVCGICDAYETQPAFPYGDCDCNGDLNGEAYFDGCGDCVGGDTGLTPCANDCLGDIGGDAVYDNCGEACIAADPQADCSEHCDDDPANDCTQDCYGDWGGDAAEDSCDVCSGGNSGHEADSDIDDCGGCFGGNADMDCNDDCFGDAEEDGFGGCCYLGEQDDCGVCFGNDDCFGCNDWYMENFICDYTGATDKCCVEDDNNNDNRCKINVTGNNCDISPHCQKEYIMECDVIGEYCDYDGAAVGDPCSTSAGSFTEGEGLCRKYCDPSLTIPGSCFNRECDVLGGWCDSPGNCFNIVCDDSGEYCDYAGAGLGTPCSTSEVSFTVGEGSCILDLSDEIEGSSCILDLSDDVNISTGYITYYDTGCEDGTDDCCEVPECDGITLSIEAPNPTTLQVNYLSTVNIGGFQFALNGATVTAGSGGDAAANNFDIIAMGNFVLSFDQGGSSIPAGSGILTILTISTSGNQLCLENVVFSDPNANLIVNCPEYTALWPAPGQQVECITIP